MSTTTSAKTIAPSAVVDLIAFMGLISLLLIVTMLIVAFQLHLQLKWLRTVLVPYFHNLAQFLNPEKK